MSLTLVPPGQRKGNTYWYVRGTFCGVSIEVSTKTRDEKAARKFKAELELTILDGRVPGPGEEVTFAKAVELYKAWRSPSDDDVRRIDRLVTMIGHRLVGNLTQADLVKVANDLFPSRSAATRNREALQPAAIVLHYAARQNYCAWLRIELFKQPRPKTRAVTQDTARVLLANLPDISGGDRWKSERSLKDAARLAAKRKLLILWLFRQGTRISDALRVKGADIDLNRRTVRMHIRKLDIYVEDPLHDEVWELLANDPPGPGPLFPWKSRASVYKWLRPYTRKLGIAFTPHMARHSLGKWLNEDGASLREIMDTLHHNDPKSSIRYQSTDVEVIRQRGKKLAKLT